MAEVTEQPTEEAREMPSDTATPVSAVGTSELGINKLSSAAKKKKAKRRKVRRTIIILVIVAALIGGIAFGMYRLFREDEAISEVMTAFIMRGSIQSTVIGSGQALPKESATISLASAGTVLEVFVNDGDIVSEGDPLYIIDSTAAVAALEDAQKAVSNLQKQIDSIMKSYNDLIVRAEFSGTLILPENSHGIKVGDYVGSNTSVATLVDDSRMKLELEFSYAYEGMITVGQTAVVSIPKAMNELSGVVTEVNYVRRITQEGAALFRAVITVDNPGSLTEGMDASAMLFGEDGLDIYPYAGAKLEFNRSDAVQVKASGTALTVNLKDYSRVEAGQLLLELDAESNDETVASLENQLRTAQGALERAEKSLENFNATAPMSGTVLSCSLTPGETIDAGRVAVTIANTTKMVIEARIDEMNVAYVKPGMTCTVTQYSMGEPLTFMGVVESVSLEGKFENGMSTFPAVITVDNVDGTLMSGMYVEYNFVASQSDDCLLAPVQAIKYTTAGACLFIKADSPPPDALDTEALGIEVPEGFYAVLVTIGIADNYNAEIIEGVDENTEVYTQMSPSGGMGGGMGGVLRIG